MTLPPFPSFASPSFTTHSQHLFSPNSIFAYFFPLQVTSGPHSLWAEQSRDGTPTLCLLPPSALFIRPDKPSVHSTHKNLFYLFNIIKTLEIFCCGVVFACELIFVYDHEQSSRSLFLQTACFTESHTTHRQRNSFKQFSLWNNVFIPTKPLNWLWTLCDNRWQGLHCVYCRLTMTAASWVWCFLNHQNPIKCVNC